uniref:Serine carboxypeptidase n=1 Tax=Rhipicephalus zambeziensis TaxID=60191 RepID=A0A224Z894_9ACAR
MTSSSAWTLLILAAGLQYVGSDNPEAPPQGGQEASNGQPPLSSTDDEALFLTPLIDACEYYTAREKSKVNFASLGANITAHSGYITVNNTQGNKSHLFFVLTEVEGNSSEAPLLLWTQGGPGLSALFGLYLENGPVAFYASETMTPILQLREKTLQKNMSVLYLDLPVGSGFSFTNETGAYPTKMQDVVDHVMQFLEQFLRVFSEYRQRDFYLAGESYGARYSVSVANELLKNPENHGSVDLRLKGVISGNGFLGPIYSIANSSDFLYSVSMLTAENRDLFAQKFNLMETLVLETKYADALGLLSTTIFADPTWSRPTLFQNLTLYSDHASPLFTQRPARMLACFVYLNTSTDLRKALHVGKNAIFQYDNRDLQTSFALDWLTNMNSTVENVLAESSMLFYTGQIDALFPSVKQREYLSLLSWTSAAQYKTAQRFLWKPYPLYYGFAGYIKETEQLIDAVLLGMSHYGAVDKPDQVYDLIMYFLDKQKKKKALKPV